MRHMWDEFKDFAMKGNALDLAIGVIIGAAFSPIVTTLVTNVMMPIIGYVTAGVNFSNLEAVPVEGVDIKYGLTQRPHPIPDHGDRAVLPDQGDQHGAQAQARSGAGPDAVGDLPQRDPRRAGEGEVGRRVFGRDRGATTKRPLSGPSKLRVCVSVSAQRLPRALVAAGFLAGAALRALAIGAVFFAVAFFIGRSFQQCLERGTSRRTESIGPRKEQ
jgi:hypothetical protein